MFERSRIFIIEDDPIMSECLVRICCSLNEKPQVKIFHDAISAMAELDKGLPDLILLDVLLNGPDGFTFLNELSSYSDTADIPVIIITSLTLSSNQLAHYGVRQVIQKETMLPNRVKVIIEQTLRGCCCSNDKNLQKVGK